ncbi:putative deoxyribonuclease RhsA [Paraburkholderia gardini]|uniref:Deoxyribonuclease RhsA n=2 Tax=Paraburkholderia gardini TaxID=2823469 RepID=A0ABM8U457_9BURK|nr:putative deoxyribonuclease RhsA [Paraburkholderia gardini]
MSWFQAPVAYAEVNPICVRAYVNNGAYPADPACLSKAATASVGMACYGAASMYEYCNGPSAGDTVEPVLPEESVTMDGDAPDGERGDGGSCAATATAGCGNSTSGADPVNLLTGQFRLVTHDLHVADIIPVDIARVYRSGAYDTSGRPVVGAFGVGATFAYDSYLTIDAGDANNMRQRIELRLPSGVRVPFTLRPNASTTWDNLTSPGEYFGARLSDTDRTGQSKTLTFRDGAVQRFTAVNGLYRLSRVQDRAGNVVQIERDNKTGAITKITSPGGRGLILESVVGNLGTPLISRITDPLNRHVVYAYDSEDRLVQVTDAAGGVWKYSWDSAGRLLEVRDPEEHVQMTNTYDDHDRVVAQRLADGSAFGFAYKIADGKVMQSEVTDRRGSIRRLEFDVNGRVVRNTYPAGQAVQQVQTFAYDATGRITGVTSADRQYRYAYDTQGNRISEADQYSTFVTRTYDSYNMLLTEAQAGDPALGFKTVYGYDTQGNLVTITDRLGNRTTMTYDKQGRQLTSTDALKGVTRYTWTGPDLTAVTDPLNRTTQFTTDAVGRLVAIQDPPGNMTRRTLDALDRPVDITDATGGRSHLTWDRNGHLLSHADAKGVTTRYTYNAIGLPVSRTDPLGHSESYTWNGAGQIATATDRKGQVRTYTYDVAGHLRKVDFRPQAAAAISRSWQYGWDVKLNRLSDVTDSQPGLADAVTLFSYEQVSGKYTAAWEWPSKQGYAQYLYAPDTRDLQQVIFDRATASFSRDAERRVTQIEYQINDDVRTVQLAYDSLGRRTRMTMANGITADYSWDAAGQLTGLTYRKSNGSLLGDLTYGYDAAGRRVKTGGSLAKVVLPQPQSDIEYNAANQLTRWAGKTLTWDLNGNLSNDGVNRYEWNEQNLLSQMSGAVTAAFSYDAFGRRRVRNVAGSPMNYFWDGDELDLAIPSGDWAQRGRLFSAYPDSDVDEQTLRRIGDDASQDRYFLRDGNNNVIALTDSDQQIQTQYRYEPYGATTLTGAADMNTQQFTGRENDGTGLYYYRNRYYSPQTGRFISEDPIGYASGQTNAYAYVSGNPVQFTDPSGLAPGDKWYGFNDRNFQRWAHTEKQIMGRAPHENFTQSDIKELWNQWQDLGCPAPGSR